MSSNRIAIAMAAIALVLALATAIRPYIFRERVEYPGISFVRLRDGDSGEVIGFIRAEYGAVTVGRIGKNDLNRVELKLADDVTIEFHKGRHVVAKWTVSEAGDKFEKLTQP